MKRLFLFFALLQGVASRGRAALLFKAPMRRILPTLCLLLCLCANARGAGLVMYFEGISSTANANDSGPAAGSGTSDWGSCGCGTDINWSSSNPPTGNYWANGFLNSAYMYSQFNCFLLPGLSGQAQFRATIWMKAAPSDLVHGQDGYLFDFGRNGVEDGIYALVRLGNSITGESFVRFNTNLGASLLSGNINLLDHATDWLELTFDFDNGVRSIILEGYTDAGGTFHADGSTLATDDISGSHTETEAYLGNGPCSGTGEGLIGLNLADQTHPFKGALNGVQFFSNATFSPTETPTPTNTPIPTPNGDTPRLLSVIGGQSNDAHMYWLDPSNGDIKGYRLLVPPSGNIISLNALARRPTTKVLYCIYQLDDFTRRLAKVNEITGELTIVHTVGNVNGLAFDTAGNGWATQKAAGPNAPINLHKYNVTSWSDQDKGDITPSDYNSDASLAFNPDDGLLYFSYQDNSNYYPALETIELTGFTKTELGEIQGDLNGTSICSGSVIFPGCMAWNPVDSNLFFMGLYTSSCAYNFFSLSTTAASSAGIGLNVLEYQHGLVYIPTEFVTNTPGPTDTPTFSPTPTPAAGTSTPTPTASPTPSITATNTPSPTITKTASPTASPSVTPTSTPTPWPTPVPPLGPARKPMWEDKPRRGIFGGFFP